MKPFWERKRLDQMTPKEWESLCDGCGLCCFVDTKDARGVHQKTRACCELLDCTTRKCSDYPNRLEINPACDVLTPHNLDRFALPPTCGYLLVKIGEPLPSWHPLLNGGDASGVPEAVPLPAAPVPVNLARAIANPSFVTTLIDRR